MEIPRRITLMEDERRTLAQNAPHNSWRLDRLREIATSLLSMLSATDARDAGLEAELTRTRELAKRHEQEIAARCRELETALRTRFEIDAATRPGRVLTISARVTHKQENATVPPRDEPPTPTPNNALVVPPGVSPQGMADWQEKLKKALDSVVPALPSLSLKPTTLPETAPSDPHPYHAAIRGLISWPLVDVRALFDRYGAYYPLRDLGGRVMQGGRIFPGQLLPLRKRYTHGRIDTETFLETLTGRVLVQYRALPGDEELIDHKRVPLDVLDDATRADVFALLWCLADTNTGRGEAEVYHTGAEYTGPRAGSESVFVIPRRLVHIAGGNTCRAWSPFTGPILWSRDDHRLDAERLRLAGLSCSNLSSPILWAPVRHA